MPIITVPRIPVQPWGTWHNCPAWLRFLCLSHLSRYHAQLLHGQALYFSKTVLYLKTHVLPHLQTLELWWKLWISQAGTGQDPCWLTEAGGELLVSLLLSRKARLLWSEWHTLNTKEKRLKPDIKQQQNTTESKSVLTWGEGWQFWWDLQKLGVWEDEQY